jgi:hypothetical protein
VARSWLSKGIDGFIVASASVSIFYQVADRSSLLIADSSSFYHEEQAYLPLRSAEIDRNDEKPAEGDDRKHLDNKEINEILYYAWLYTEKFEQVLVQDNKEEIKDIINPLTSEVRQLSRIRDQLVGLH